MQAYDVCITMSHVMKQGFCLHGKGWPIGIAMSKLNRGDGVVVEDM